MGICGTGMAGLAGMLKEAGYLITGSDQNVYPPMSDFLASIHIPVVAGYSAKNLSPRPDLVVVGNVITRKNPEALELARQQIPYVSMPQALGHYFLKDHFPLVVCGTHCKTTTSSMLTSVLHKAGEDCGFMIGGLVKSLGRNFHIGTSRYYVIEGDEYDSAFFDKGPKFLHYQPQVAIITSIEFDHADIYQDLAAVKKSFQQLVAILPPDGCLVACYDDAVVREVAAKARCPVVAYGSHPEAEWKIGDFDIQRTGTSFHLLHNGEPYNDLFVPMPGRHNVLNSIAVIAVLERLGFSKKIISEGLSSFEGVRRRQEVRGKVDGITVIDDFAHHPTAVRETLAALATAYQGSRLLAVFEPRTNSSRRRVFQDTYIDAFDHVDQVVVKEPIPLTTIPAEERFSARQLVENLTSRGKKAQYFATTEEILDHLAGNSRSGDVIAILSNGGFDNIHERLLKRLAERQ
jgi:UDP-N-acetylmuramate: L-alanyl-gamma-D-glutamyl-meso-diaminopimelate ligase